MRTPSASSTSAEPHLDVNDRLPCLATTAPAPAATNAAAVEILKVETAPPPVPQVSTRCVPVASTRTIASRSARAAPATSSGVSPFTRKPINRAAIWTGVASPRITAANTSVAWGSLKDRRAAGGAIACSSGGGAGGGDGGTGRGGFWGSQNHPRKKRFFKIHKRV